MGCLGYFGMLGRLGCFGGLGLFLVLTRGVIGIWVVGCIFPPALFILVNILGPKIR
jgi:hypothetical protein